MAQRTQHDENMPNSMPISMLLIAVEEIGSDRIEDAFGHYPPKSGMRHTQPHRPNDQQRHPAHDQIERQRQTRMATQGNELTDRTHQHARPEKSEKSPSYPTTQHTEADDRIGTRNHDVDTDMVEDTQTAFVDRSRDGMVERRRKEHEEHAQQEQARTEHVEG